MAKVCVVGVLVVVAIFGLRLIAPVGLSTTSETRTAIRQFLSGKRTSARDMALVNGLGNESIPLVYEEVRHDPSQWDRGVVILIRISRSKGVDPSAAYIRSVLDNTQETRSVRLMSAELLAWYPGSNRVLDALIDHATHGSDPHIRAECIDSLGAWYYWSLKKGMIATRDNRVQHVLAVLLNDPRQTIRRCAYEAIADVAVARLRSGVEARWAESMLRAGMKDESYSVRKAVGQLIAKTLQEKRHPENDKR